MPRLAPTTFPDLVIDSDRMNYFSQLHDLHVKMIKDLDKNDHVAPGLFADWVLMINSKTEGQEYFKRWQEIADSIRNLPAVRTKLLGVKQEGDDAKSLTDTKTPMHILRLLKGVSTEHIPRNPVLGAPATCTYDPDEMFQLWLAIRARGKLEIWHRGRKEHLDPITDHSSDRAPSDYSTCMAHFNSLFGCLECNLEAQVLLFFLLNENNQETVGGRRNAVQPRFVKTLRKNLVTERKPTMDQLWRCLAEKTDLSDLRGKEALAWEKLKKDIISHAVRLDRSKRITYTSLAFE